MLIKLLILCALLFPYGVSAKSQTQGLNTPVSVCFERWWPFSFEDEKGRAQGIVVDMLREVEPGINVTFVFDELPYKRCVDYVRAGKIDFTLHVDETDHLFMINETMANWDITFAVRKGEYKHISDIVAADNLRILVAEEYDYPEIVYTKLREMGHQVIANSYYEMSDAESKMFFELLLGHRVDAILIDQHWAQRMVEQHKIPVDVFTELLHREPQHIGFIRSRIDMALKIEKALSTIPERVKKEISARYR